MTDVNTHAEVRMGSARSFGIVFSIVFAIIGLWPVIFASGGIRTWSLAIALGFLVVTIASPGALAPLNKAWFHFGMLLGKIITPIVMGLIYFLTVVPIGVIRRWTNPDPLNQTFDAELESYWVDRDPDELAASSMKKQY